MKLHHNTVLRGELVVPTSSANLLKPKSLVQASGRRVGFSDLQKHGHRRPFEEPLEQRASHAGAPIGGVYREVEDFDLIRDRACDEESNHASVDLRDRDIEPLRVPLGSIRRRTLDLCDRGSIFLTRRANRHSYFLGA
jgi:hypothetical protein